MMYLHLKFLILRNENCDIIKFKNLDSNPSFSLC